MSADRRTKLRELVIRGATEGEREAALSALEAMSKKPSFFGTETDNIETSLVTISKNQGVIVQRLERTVVFGASAILANLWWGWGVFACLVFAAVCSAVVKRIRKE